MKIPIVGEQSDDLIAGYMPSEKQFQQDLVSHGGAFEPTEEKPFELLGFVIEYAAYPQIYTVKILLTMFAIFAVWPGYRQFPFRVTLLAPVVGIVGVVLWIGICMDSGNLLSKVAFHRAGIPFTQLTTDSHPFSSSRFGMRFINRIHTAVEERYSVARVVLSTNNTAAALKDLTARLGDNEIVAFTAHKGGKRPVTGPFMDGEIVLGPGAAIMAQKTRAPLLPVFTFRDASDVVTVTVGPRIDVRQDIPTPDAITDVIRQYAAILEPFVLENPAQWRGWRLL